MTTEERLQTVENTVRNQGDRLERHSKRLEKLERSSEEIAETKAMVKGMDTRLKRVEHQQAVMDKKLMRKSNWTIGLLCVIGALIVYIAFKSPTTAKEVLEITGKTLVEGVATTVL